MLTRLCIAASAQLEMLLFWDLAAATWAAKMLFEMLSGGIDRQSASIGLDLQHIQHLSTVLRRFAAFRARLG